MLPVNKQWIISLLEGVQKWKLLELQKDFCIATCIASYACDKF